MKNFTDMTMRSITPNLLQTNMNGHNKANPEVIPYVAIEGRQNDTGKNTSCSFNQSSSKMNGNQLMFGDSETTSQNNNAGNNTKACQVDLTQKSVSNLSSAANRVQS